MAGTARRVCNELTPESRAALADNIVTMVIATPVERLSRELVGADGAGDRDRRRRARPGQMFLPFDIYHAGEHLTASACAYLPRSGE